MVGWVRGRAVEGNGKVLKGISGKTLRNKHYYLFLKNITDRHGIQRV